MARSTRVAEVVAVLAAAGGVMRGTEIIGAVSRQALRSAAACGVVSRLGPNLYGLTGTLPTAAEAASCIRSWSAWDEEPSEDETRLLRYRHETAFSLRGALAMRCAAAHHDWMLLRQPSTVEVAVPRSRRLPRADGLSCHHRDLSDAELSDGVTAHRRTVVDCASALPFTEALAVADSAMRAGAIGPIELERAGLDYRGPNAAQVRRVCALADGQAANPFESAVRAIAADVPEVRLVPQHHVADSSFQARVDLADERLRIVVEAEGKEFHAGTDDFEADCVRYNQLVARDWLVLRFTVHDTRARPEWMREMLRATVLVRRAQGYE
ncbi:MAG: hypothetical protein Q4F67_14745 [Propionibacteriaceae bacterium]|nr:hypothetical protein [Propionibacteriaceae bacterium]